jgi:hypothetical protein
MTLVVDRGDTAAPKGDFEVAAQTPDGTPCALSRREGERLWLRVPGVALFRAESGSDQLAVRPDDDASDEMVVDAYRGMALPLLLQAQGWEALHAGAVRRDFGVVALCATSETGKTTTAWGLSARRGDLWADDVMMFAVEPGGVRTVPLPFRPQLRPASRGFFGALEDPSEHLPALGDESVLRVLVVLEREEGADVTIERLPISDAFPAMLPHAFRFGMNDAARHARTVEAYLELTSTIPVLRARFPPGWERFDGLLDALEDAIAEHSA